MFIILFDRAFVYEGHATRVIGPLPSEGAALAWLVSRAKEGVIDADNECTLEVIQHAV